jgi:hypothetical protein
VAESPSAARRLALGHTHPYHHRPPTPLCLMAIFIPFTKCRYFFGSGDAWGNLGDIALFLSTSCGQFYFRECYCASREGQISEFG